MQPEGSESAETIKKFSLPGLFNSLRWRQLAISLVIIATGLSGAGSLYFYLQNKLALEKQGQEMEKNGQDILVGITHVKELQLFVVDNEVYKKEDFKRFLDQNKFTTEIEREVEYFAYIQSVKNRAIAWSSKHAFEDPIKNESPYATLQRRDYPLFEIDVEVGSKTETVIIPPIIRKGRNPNAKKQKLGTKYIVNAVGFSFDKTPYKLVLARAATRIIEDKKGLKRDLTWLVLFTSLLVLVSQLVGSYIVLSPIRRIEKEIKLIEAGEQQLIKHEYPSELNPVKSAINTLINAEKGQKRRYREALDNLAHALKTPLAALQGASERSTDGQLINQAYVDDHIQRMNDIVAYHLRRAVVSDHNAIVQLESLRPIVFRLRNSLMKVYFDKGFTLDINIDEFARCRVDYDDLMEVFGNLLNNACRFCESKIVVTATQDIDYLVIDIDDDGMGFPDNNPAQLLTRGMRADSKTEGQGIGLAVSAEIVKSAGGKITLLMSPFIGARVRLHLPV
ncbi:MAG: ATP-binding protein [Leucothrix sp.]